MEKFFAIAVVLLPSVGAAGRVWSDIVSPTVLNPIDSQVISYLIRNDPFASADLLPPEPVPAPDPVSAPLPVPTPESFTTAPTQSPTTSEPTIAPTSNPTYPPTPEPTEPPTMAPTPAPTVPPTLAPTETPDPYPENPPPTRPPSWYFNYNMSDASAYGPGELSLLPVDGTFRVGVKNNNWGDVGNPPNFYWKEFTDEGWGPWKGVLENRVPSRNLCESGKMQSPIDVRENGAVCDEHHEVRSLVSTTSLFCSTLFFEEEILTFFSAFYVLAR